MARLFSFATLAALAACGGNRLQSADAVAATAGLRFRAVPTASYTIATWSHFRDASSPVTVYIEGDGAAYGPDGQFSLDPTPRRALALHLAAEDPGPNIVYLARPCQFVRDQRCSPPDWTTRRFDEPAIAAMGEALDRLVQPGARINLVGYSGGAAIAVHLAARHAGVASLRTIAGNLDPYGVNRLHGATEQLIAVDPMAVAASIARIPQRHFVGGDDSVVPSHFAEAFLRAEGAGACAAATQVAASHERGWDDAWPSLLRLPLPCSGAGGT